MELRRFHEADDFLQRAGRFLLQHEAHHNLILGICGELKRHPDRIEQPPYLAIVEERDAVVAAAAMTPPHNLVLSLVEDPQALPPIAADVFEHYGALPGVLGPADVSRSFAGLYHELSGQPYRKGMAQRIYQLETVQPVFGVPGALRRATEADRHTLIAWFAAFGREALGDADGPDAKHEAERAVDRFLGTETRGIYLWEDGRPVSMAGFSGPTPNGIRINAVYTPPEYRRRGYASACVAALSQLLLDRGYRYCFLFTDLSNPTSNHIYQLIGYQAVCDVDEYRFSQLPDSETV